MERQQKKEYKSTAEEHGGKMGEASAHLLSEWGRDILGKT